MKYTLEDFEKACSYLNFRLKCGVGETRSFCEKFKCIREGILCLIVSCYGECGSACPYWHDCRSCEHCEKELVGNHSED